MRIGIDGYNLAIPNGTGVATYGAALASALTTIGHQVEGVFGLDPGSDPKLREVLFFERFGRGQDRRAIILKVAPRVLFRSARRHLIPVPLTDHVEKRGPGSRWPAFSALWTSPYLFEEAIGRFRLTGRVTRVTMPNPPDIMHWTYPVPLCMTGSKNIYTFHDLVPLKLPYTTLDNKRFYYRLSRTLLDQADHIITVSNASRTDILNIFDADPARVSNLYQASPLPEGFAATGAADVHAMVETAFGLPRRGFYLFFGASDPKKNVGRIVEAYLASRSDRPLVIVSSRDWGMSEANGGLSDGAVVYGRKVDRPIIRMHYLPRDMLFRLIMSARAVLFPSLYEGFGLPALEALQLGTPVIGSDTSSVPEVVGPGGILVNPYDTNAIAEAIRRLDRDDDLVIALGKAGQYHATQFSEDRFADRLQDLYSRLGR